LEPIAPPSSAPGAPPAPRSLGKVLDAGFDLLRGSWALLVGLWALVYVPLSFAGEVAPGEGAPLPPAQAVWFLALLPVVVVGTLAVTAAVTDACGDLLHGRPTDAGRALRRGLALVGPLLGAILAMMLVALLAALPLAAVMALRDSIGVVQVPAAIAAGFLLFAVLVRLSLLTQVVVFERRTWLGAVARANRLIEGHVLRVFGTYLVVGVLVTLLGGAAGLALSALPAVGPAAVGIVQALGSAYSTAVGVVLYEDVRLRQGEGALPAAEPTLGMPG
jgi:hypothetical protein